MKKILLTVLLFSSCTRPEQIIPNQSAIDINGVFVNFDCIELTIQSSKGFQASYTDTNGYHIIAIGDTISIEIWNDSCHLYTRNLRYWSDSFVLTIANTKPLVGSFVGNMRASVIDTQLQHLSGRFKL